MTMLRTTLGLAAAVATATALAAAAGPASAAEIPHVAATGDGGAHFSWVRGDGARVLLQGRTRLADGTLTDTEYLSSSASNAFPATVLRGADGVAIHVWQDAGLTGNTVRIRRQSPNGTLGPVQTVSEPGVAGLPRAAADPAGNVVLVWPRSVGGKMVIESRRRTANGSLSPVKRLSAANPTYSATDPQVAVDAAGHAVVTWNLAVNPASLQIRRRAADGTLSPIQNLTSGGAASGAEVGVDSAGNAVVAFRRYVGDGFRIQVRRRSAAGTLSAVQNLSPVMQAGHTPEVAVSPSAGAVVAWRHPAPGGKSHVSAAFRPPGGAWTEGQLVSTLDANHLGFTLGIDADGDALFLMTRATGESTSALELRRRSAAGTLGAVEPLTPADGDVGDHDLAVEPDGGAFATWVAPVEGTPQVHYRRRTASGEIGPAIQLSY